MANRDTIVIGASAGGVEALQRLCAGLPADLEAAVFIAQHLSPSARSVLPSLLDKAGPLPVSLPQDGDLIERGRIYVAAPDYHMLLRPGRVLMRRGPHENRTRPAVNPLFRSAAIHYGARTIGVILTGLLDDGTEGLVAITAAGGCSVAQDPDDAQWPSMPRSAIARDHVNFIAPVSELPDLLVRLSREGAAPSVPLPEAYLVEDRIAAKDELVIGGRDEQTPGEPSSISCPDCGGVLNHIEIDGEPHFRCQIGHAFTPRGLGAAQGDELERALAIAMRTHRDRMKLFSQMSESARSRGLAHAGRRWELAYRESADLVTVLEEAMKGLRRRED